MEQRNNNLTQRQRRKQARQRIASRHAVKKAVRKTERLNRQKRIDTRKYRISLRMIFTILLIFSGGIGTAFSYAILEDTRRDINAAHNKLQQKRSENSVAQTIITRHFSMDELEEIATLRLGMMRPDPAQIIFINVPRQSIVVQNIRQEPSREMNMWQSAWQIIRNWFGNGG